MTQTQATAVAASDRAVPALSVQNLRKTYDVGAGPMRTLLARLDVEGFVLDIDGALPPQLPQIEGTTVQARDDHTLDIEMPRAMDLNRVFAALGDAGIRVRSMRTKSNRLEELFVRMVAAGDSAPDEAANTTPEQSR